MAAASSARSAVVRGAAAARARDSCGARTLFQVDCWHDALLQGRHHQAAGLLHVPHKEALVIWLEVEVALLLLKRSGGAARAAPGRDQVRPRLTVARQPSCFFARGEVPINSPRNNAFPKRVVCLAMLTKAASWSRLQSRFSVYTLDSGGSPSPSSSSSSSSPLRLRRNAADDDFDATGTVRMCAGGCLHSFGTWYCCCRRWITGDAQAIGRTPAMMLLAVMRTIERWPK